MAAKDLGTKFTCYKCGTKFYDLKKPDPLCPKCGADQRDASAQKASDKPERKRAPRAVVEEPAAPAEEEALDEELPEEDEADEVPEEDEDDEA